MKGRTNKMSNKYHVWVSVPFDSSKNGFPRDMNVWKEINRIATKVDSDISDSGTGYGARDIGWEKDTLEEAKDLKRLLKRAFLKWKGTEVGYDLEDDNLQII